jgi:hypothetical protein
VIEARAVLLRLGTWRGGPRVSIPELERLLDRWEADPAFRAALRHDPEGEITRAGFQLDDTEWAAISDTDWSLPDADLRARMANLWASPPA